MRVQNSQKAVNLTKYLISLPNTKTTVFLIILLSMLFGLLFGFLSGRLDNGRTALSAIGNGLFLLTIPTILSAILIYAIKRKLRFKQIIFLCFSTMVIYALSYAISLFFSEPLNLIILLIGFGLVFAFWYLIFNTVFGLNKLAVVFALIQLSLNSLFLLFGRYIYVSNEPLEILIKIYFASAIFLGGIYVFLLLVNAPMKRVFGIKSTEAFNLFLSQWMHRSKGLEETFEDIGQTIETQVGIARFKGKKQDILFIVPYIHFGPFGNLGGSEFSFLIADQFKDKSCFVFHGTATHDFNPVSSDEITKITYAIKQGIKKMRLKPVKAQLKNATYKTCTAHCIEFKNNSFIGLTRAPNTTEDIEYSIGTSLINKAEQFTKNSIVFDEHNAETGNIDYIVSGSPYYQEFINSIETCLLKKERAETLRIGISKKEVDINNIGKAGIKLALLKTKKTMIWILVDSNGIKPDTKDKMIKVIEKFVKEKNPVIEIMTTDTHEINNVKGVLNPITDNEAKEMLPIIKQMLIEAESNIEVVKGDLIKIPLTINVFGTMHTSELISTINAIVAIAKIALPFILITTIIIVLWGLTLL